MGTISTGNAELDIYLGGGYEKGVVTTFYGASSSGKTNLVLLSAVRCAEKGGNVVIIDTEGGIAVERIRQLSSSQILDKFNFYQPLDWEDQLSSIDKLSLLLRKKTIDLVVIDSIAMLYRLAMGDNVYQTNRDMAKHIGNLVHIAREYQIPVLITNQVYNRFDDDKVRLVGGDLLKYTSKALLYLECVERNHLLRVDKHRFIKQERPFTFNIINTGIDCI